MTMLRVGRAAELLGVGPDTLRRWVDSGRLSAGPRQEGGHRLIDSASLAALALELAAEQSSAPPGRESARNRFEGLVTRVVRDRVMTQVDIQSGPHRLVALITTEAAEELRLEPGSIAVAAVKASSVIVELPPSSEAG